MGNVSSVDSTITPDYIRKAVDQIRLDTPGPQQVKAFLNIYKVVTNETFVKFLQVGRLIS